jgi:hypothetical protein
MLHTPIEEKIREETVADVTEMTIDAVTEMITEMIDVEIDATDHIKLIKHRNFIKIISFYTNV